MSFTYSDSAQTHQESLPNSQIPNDNNDFNVQPKVESLVESNKFIVTSYSIESNFLPSKGLSYLPLKPTINYKPYTYGELKAINSQRLPPLKLIELEIESLKCSEMKIENLTVPDFYYILLHRKIVTYGDNLSRCPIVWKCQYCNSKQTNEINIQQLEFADLQVPELPIEVTLSNNKILRFSPITVRNYKELLKADTLKDPNRILACQCLNYPMNEAYNIIFNSSLAQDGELLDEVDRLLFHDIKPVEYKCSQCEAKNSINLGGDNSLLLPFHSDKDLIRNRIKFGKTQSN